MTISIVVVNFNGVGYLKETLPVLETLCWEGTKEIIVVDGRSTDESPEYLSKWEAENPKSRRYVISKAARPGHKIAMVNEGVKASRGTYLWLTDNDIVPQDPNLLTKIVDLLIHNPQIGCITPSLINRGADKTKWYGRQVSWCYLVPQPMLSLGSVREKHLSACAVAAWPFLSREWWDNCGGYDETLIFSGDDDDLGLQTWGRGKEVRVYADTTCIHLGQPEKDDPRKFKVKWARSIQSFYHTIIKNYPTNQIGLTLIIVTPYLGMLTGIYAYRLKSWQMLLAYFIGLRAALQQLPISINLRRKRAASGVNFDSAYWHQR